MVEDEGKKDEEKFDFTNEGEALGYVSPDQARVLAMQSARETPGAYGRRFRGVPMAFKVVEDEDTEDHYVITLSFRPQGQFSGTPGREQFFIEKEGTIAHRQVLSVPLPTGDRRFPVVPAIIGLAVLGAVTMAGIVFAVNGLGGQGSDQFQAAAVTPTGTPLPTPTDIPVVVIPPTNTSVPAETPLPTPTAASVPTNTPLPTDKPTVTLGPPPTPVTIIVTATPSPTATLTPIPSPTPTPTTAPVSTATTAPMPTPTPTPTPRPTAHLPPVPAVECVEESRLASGPEVSIQGADDIYQLAFSALCARTAIPSLRLVSITDGDAIMAQVLQSLDATFTGYTELFRDVLVSQADTVSALPLIAVSTRPIPLDARDIRIVGADHIGVKTLGPP